jgi:hypothetical protein
MNDRHCVIEKIIRAQGRETLVYQVHGDPMQTEFSTRQVAERFCAALNRLPDGYKIFAMWARLHLFDREQRWIYTLHSTTDPNWKGHRGDNVTMLPALAQRHAANLAAAKAAEAEKAAAAATAAAHAFERAKAEREHGPLAAPAQVDLIMRLLRQPVYNVEGSEFTGGPTDRQSVELLTKNEATRYIRRLTGGI